MKEYILWHVSITFLLLLLRGWNWCQVTMRVWFSRVVLVRLPSTRLIRWLRSNQIIYCTLTETHIHPKKVAFPSRQPRGHDRPHWGGHQPSDPAGWGHLRGDQAVEGGDQMPPTLFSQGWLSPWLQDPQAPPKKSPLEELASGLQEVHDRNMFAHYVV